MNDSNPSTPARREAGAPPLECRNVWKIFGERADAARQAVRSEGLGKPEVLERFGCVVAVADVSFSVGKGEIFCIMGLSGSGKSTLVRHLNRLIEPTEGEIFVDGENINAKGKRQIRELRAKKIGMVFQNMALLPHRTVNDNATLSLELRKVDRRQRRRAAGEALALVGLAEWGERYPDELSGGMQQRVGLARALAADPEILLMDEPFSALDPLIRRQLQDQFLELAAVMKKTTVFITHDLDEAIRLGNRIAIMKDGRLVQIGTPEEIITEPRDDYVADFVKGISPVKFVHAARIMVDINEYRAGGGRVPDGAQWAPMDADLNALIQLFSDNGNCVVIRDDRGTEVGIVTTTALLQSLRSH